MCKVSPSLSVPSLLLPTDPRLDALSPHPEQHILNAQASIRAPCCKKWFDCAECHAAVSDHPLARTTEMAFLCKKCKKAFRKDMSTWDEADEFCPHCDNHFVIEAKTPNAIVGVEGDDARVDNRMLRDDRIRDGKISSTADDERELEEFMAELGEGEEPEGGGQAA
ncbi:hypothetical protein JCM10207_004420 [Rhodosporidiobolus poonsookiae]